MPFLISQKTNGVARTPTTILRNGPQQRKPVSHRTQLLIFSLSLYIAPAIGLASAGSGLLDIPLEQLGQIEITTAAKVPELLSKTSATVSVITASEIRRMGARTIYDALARLPGVNIGLSQFGDHFISIRGIRTNRSEKLLLLLDGHLLNEARSGSALSEWLNSLPVDNIARIEMVRGPGSALYGANAFLGVINIITKRPDEIDHVELAASNEFESAGTIAWRYNLLAGGDLSENWEGGINFNVVDSPGPELNVKSDALGRSGTADTHFDRLDVQGNISNGPFTLRSRYMRRKAGDEFGSLYVLNNASTQKVEYTFLDAEYHARPSDNGDLTLRAYVDHQDADNYYVGLPAGTIPSTSVYFPWNSSGLIGDLLAKETNSGAEARFDYRAITSHTLSAGLAWRREELHDVRLLANADPNHLPQVTDVTDHFNWIDPASRDIASLYIQDLWDIEANLRVTMGARYDHFSDSGSTFNPRLGLIWQFQPEMSARLTYGEAFRAPSFADLHLKNNPAQLGNPDLAAERIETWEAGVNWQPGQFQTDLTLFRSHMHNLIDFPTGSIQYQNLGKATVYGLELEARYHFQSYANIAANYSYADAEYTNLEPSIMAPPRHLNLMADIPLPMSIAWNINVSWQSETPRAMGDNRPSVASVWLLNTALTMKREHWDYTAAVYNLTDQDYANAAPAGTLPGDFTAPGRSILLGVRYEL